MVSLDCKGVYVQLYGLPARRPLVEFAVEGAVVDRITGYREVLHAALGGVELGLVDIRGVAFLLASLGAAGQCQGQN